MAYAYTNRKGKTYYLQGRETTLKGTGKSQTLYFFASEAKDGALDALPPGRIVAEQPSGLPILKKG